MSQHQARKRFGQHFLVDQGILSDITRAIAPHPDDHMVEIGPGLGALTHWVLPYVDHLHVVEIDRDLAARHRNGPHRNKLTVIEQDVLSFDFKTLPSPLRVIGNLPYNISSPLLFHLTHCIDQVKDQHFMLQKEVIDRMAAEPGSKDFGRLSVMLKAFYHIDWLFDVPPEAFDPPPRVMSAIVRMTPKPAQERQLPYPAMFSKLVAQAFSQRRKMLRNTLSGLVSAEQAESVGMKLTDRAEDVPVETYVALSTLLGAHQATTTPT